MPLLPQAETDAFKCGKCGQNKTRYYQMQTRSADEPMTVGSALAFACRDVWLIVVGPFTDICHVCISSLYVVGKC
jgi:hypothetical protein